MEEDQKPMNNYEKTLIIIQVFSFVYFIATVTLFLIQLMYDFGMPIEFYKTTVLSLVIMLWSRFVHFLFKEWHNTN